MNPQNPTDELKRVMLEVNGWADGLTKAGVS